MSDRWQIRAHPARPLSVGCPVCPAVVGRECERSNNYPRHTSYHPARVTAAIDTYLEEAAERRRLDGEVQRHGRYV